MIDEQRAMRAAYMREYAKRPGKREKHTASMREYRKRDRSKTYYVLSSARQRALQRGIPFNLTVDDVVIPERCPVLDIPLQRNQHHGGENSPSLDRKVPELGYVVGNVEVISKRANTLKNNCTDPRELCDVASYVAGSLSLHELCLAAQEFGRG